MEILRYKYYDTPDGNDLFKKLVYTTKYAGAIGLVASTYDVLLYSHPKGYGPIIGRYVYLTSPLIGMAAAFTGASFVACNFRKKDDLLNYLIGGVAAGSVYGAWKKSVFTGFKASILLGVLGLFKKHSLMEGYEIFPDAKMRYEGGATYVRNRDYTITKERPRNWTTDPAEA